MEHFTHILYVLFVIFISAQIGAEIAQRLRMPAVVGEIAAGCIIGPSALGLFEPSEIVDVFGEIGAVLLLFAVGLETKISDLMKVGKVAFIVGTLGVIVPFGFGFAWASMSAFPTSKALFVAAAFVATSAGITAKVLKDLNLLQAIESRIILGAAVIDDILAMLLLAVVTSLQGESSIGGWSIIVMLLEALAFIAAVLIVGSRFMKKKGHLLEVPVNPLSPLTLSLAGCLGLAAAASHVGLAAIIGAFLAGAVIAESTHQHLLEKQLQPILAFFVPFFFVATGAKVQLSELSSGTALWTVAVITLLAIISKLIGCGIGALSLGKRSALTIGVGMVPRGEVGIIVASLGVQLQVLSPMIFSAIVAMSLLTSIIAPPFLKPLMDGPQKS